MTHRVENSLFCFGKSSLCFFLLHLVIPSQPRNVVAIFVNQTSATINWLPPTITGDQVFYEVECERTCEVDSKACTEEICAGDENTGFEFMNKSSGRTGLLSPFVNYTCKIMAKNRVSDFAARKHKVEASNTTVTFKTNGSGESVSLFKCDKPKSPFIAITCTFYILSKYL